MKIIAAALDMKKEYEEFITQNCEGFNLAWIDMIMMMRVGC